MSAVLKVLLLGFLLYAHCDEFDIYMPKQMVALHGSCVTIPCYFTMPPFYDKDLHSGCKAKWLNSQNKLVEFTRPTTGDLTQKNCTTTMHELTEAHTQEVYFRLECNYVLKASFLNSVANITVTDTLPPPSLTPPTLSASEGQAVSVKCSAPAPCPSLPPTLTWSTVPGGHIQETLQEQQDKTYVKVSTLSFTASHLHHKKSITCSAVYSKEVGPSTYASVRMMPFVTHQPTNTSVTVTPSGPVTEHSSVTLTCSSDANPAVKHYHWYKADGGARTRIGHSAVLNMRASRETTAVFCEAQNELGTENSPVTELDVQYQPRNTGVRGTPSGPVTEHSSVTLTCSSDANPAVKHYHWYKADGGARTRIGHSAVLNMRASRETTAVFCEAQNELGTENSPVTKLDVQFPLQILRSSNCTGDSSQLICVCEVEGNPFPLIQWSFPGISSNSSISSEPLSDKVFRSVITVIKPQWKDSGPLVCHSSNFLGSDRKAFEHAYEPKAFELSGFRTEVTLSLLITSIVVLLGLICALLFVIITQNYRLKKRQSADVTSNQTPPSNEARGPCLQMRP